MLSKLNKPEKSKEANNLMSLLPPPPVVFLKKPPHNPPSHHLYLTEEAVPVELKKIVTQVEEEMAKGQVVEATQLLRKGKEIIKFSKDKLANSVIQLNLAICYYKIGLLEEAFLQLSLAEAGMKEVSNAKKIAVPNNFNASNNQFYVSLFNRLKLKRLRGKVSLQICILFSELAKHDMALKYARIGSKIHYSLIYDTLILCYGLIIKYLVESRYYKTAKKSSTDDFEQFEEAYIELPDLYHRLVNIISILTYLLEMTKDLRPELLSKSKESILSNQLEAIESYGRLKLQVNLDDFMSGISGHEWITKNKILNQVQMENVKKQQYIESSQIDVSNNEILQRITYLTVSFYCLSTEARFLEKNLPKTQSDILDSEHWLSKSLQVAYCLLPPEAPILGQIYSVHNKFHGIDKQPIPEDKEMEGCIKILRPLRRPKSTYNTKTTLCAPILIRIQTPKTFGTEEQREMSSQDLKMEAKRRSGQGNSVTIELDNSLKKNNRIRNTGAPKKLQFLNSLEKIYKNQINKTQHPLRTLQAKRETTSLQKRRLTSNEQSRDNSLEQPRRPHSNQHFKVHKKKDFQSDTIDVMQNLDDDPRLRKTAKARNVDIQINNNINLFITNQIGKPFEDNAFTIEYGKHQKKEQRGRRMVLKLVQSGPKQMSKRAMFYNKRRGSNPFVNESILPQF